MRDVITRCPACGYRCDSVMQTGGQGPARPADGDVSICLRCAAVAIFAGAEPGGLRRPTAAELDDVLTTDAAVAAIAGIRLQQSTGSGVRW